MEKGIIYGVISGLVVFLVLGIPTALVPTGLYKRVISSTVLDYIFLVLTSSLVGSYIGLSYHKNKIRAGTSSYGMIGGTIGSLFAFGCPICNALLVGLFGSTTLLVYFEPFRPILGVMSISILSLMVYMKIKSNKCKTDKC